MTLRLSVAPSRVGTAPRHCSPPRNSARGPPPKEIEHSRLAVTLIQIKAGGFAGSTWRNRL